MQPVSLDEKAPLPRGVRREYAVYGLLFLFPLAGVSVSHWFSGIYVVLALIGIAALFGGAARQPLFREERIWLWLCAAFFVSFLVSAWVNGWSSAQNKSLGVDIRYLLVVPLLLLLRRYPKGGVALLLGVLAGAFVAGGQAHYDIHVLEKGRAEGLYSPNFIGPVAALMALYLLAGWHLLPAKARWLVPLAVPVALWALILSGSRGGYLGLMAMVLVWTVMAFHGGVRRLILILALAVPVSAYLLSDQVAQRVDVAVDEVSAYLATGAPEQVHGGESSAIRLEMWRAAWMAFLDHPLLGVGEGNYKEGVQPYIDQGLVDAGVGSHGHPHNAYMSILMQRGIAGYLIFMAMLFYPLYYFLKSRRHSPQTALLGVIHITGFAFFSITDASTFDKNNFSSLYLLGMALFLSWHAARVNGVKEPD